MHPRCPVGGAVLVLVSALAQLGCRREPPGPPTATIEIDPAQRFQTMEGFGTSLIGWQEGTRNFYERDEFARLYLEELGASVLRVDLHGDSVPERSDWREISYEDFLLDGAGIRGGAYVRVAQALTRAAPRDFRVIASVWTAPAWMKENGRLGEGRGAPKGGSLSLQDLGLAPSEGRSEARQRPRTANRLRPDRYEHFAKSMVEWTRLYQRHGVDLYALSPQNEPRFSHWFESSVYTPAELAKITEVIAATFEREGAPVPRLFVPETMAHDTAANRLYLDALFSSQARRYIHAIAGHGYVDGYRADEDPAAPTRLFELALGYERPVWLTEGGTGGYAWPAPIHQLGASLMNALVSGRASLVAFWQVVDTLENEHALRTLTESSKKFAVASHFFRFVRPGMRRVAATSDDETVRVVAFDSASTDAAAGESSKSAEVTLIAMNRSKREVRLELLQADGRRRSISSMIVTSRIHDRAAVPRGKAQILPAESIATIVLSTRATTPPGD